jgi:hypothetical protein
MSAADEPAPGGRFELGAYGLFWWVDDPEIRFEPYLPDEELLGRLDRQPSGVTPRDDDWWDPEFAAG